MKCIALEDFTYAQGGIGLSEFTHFVPHALQFGVVATEREESRWKGRFIQFALRPTLGGARLRKNARIQSLVICGRKGVRDEHGGQAECRQL